MRWICDLGQYLQHGALPRPVATDDAHRLALSNVEAHVLQRPERFLGVHHAPEREHRMSDRVGDRLSKTTSGRRVRAGADEVLL